MTTDNDEFFASLAKQDDSDDRPYPASQRHRSDPKSLYCTCDDDLDALLGGGDNGDPARPYTVAELKEQFEHSLYVGEDFGASDLLEKTVENRIGIAHIWEKLNRYGVYERECVTKEVRTSADALDGVVTRACDGFEVLNTTKMMFVDVDFDLGSPQVAHEKQTSAVIAKAAEWAESHVKEKWSVRLYRTHSGLRLMATHAPYSTVGEEFDAVCKAVDADPLFQELCHIQGCYRARLTPKPERAEITFPEYHFPFNNRREEEYFGWWLQSYSDACSKYATCRLVATLGPGVIHPSLQALVALHDDATKVGNDSPLR